MRRVAEFDTEKNALKFWNFLKEKGDSSLEKNSSDSNISCEIWVFEEEQVSLAFFFLNEFKRNPNDPRFSSSPPQLFHRRFEEIEDLKNLICRKKWQSRPFYGTATLSLIIVCVAVFLLSGMGNNTELVGGFFISEKLDGQLSEFLSGEIWRPITPIFLHFNFLHILFNMFWLHDLGGQIEKRKGPKFFLSFILIIALVSNFTQFMISGPAFGGMSGVVYGLFGYVWAKTRLDPADGFRLDPMVAMIMFGLFIICFTGMFGGIANWAHAGGLAVGICWGYASAFRWNQGRG